MQSRYAIKICRQQCNKDMQYRYATKICNKDMQYRSAIQVCNKDRQRICNIYAKTCNRYATDTQQICNIYATYMQ